MSLQIGQRVGSYEITSLLGKGGMGEVYRARDLKLKREVAIKILPEKFSLDADRAIRFQREAEVLASLNHPNIGAIYDFQRVSCALSICLMESRGAAKESSAAPRLIAAITMTTAFSRG